MTQPYSKDDGYGRVIGGIIVLGLGIVFLLSNLRIIPDFGEMWPLVLVVIGIALLVSTLVKKEKGEKNEGPEIHQR